MAGWLPNAAAIESDIHRISLRANVELSHFFTNSRIRVLLNGLGLLLPNAILLLYIRDMVERASHLADCVPVPNLLR